MLSFFMALATTAAVQAPAAAAPVRMLKDVPNTTVTYYDVKGKDGKAIEKSLKKAATDPKTKQLQVVRTSWNVGANIGRRTTNGVCTITTAKADFNGSVTMPRLTDVSVVPAAVLAEWQTYVTRLEAGAAESLWTAHSQLAALESSLVGKKCEEAEPIWTAGVEQIKVRTAQVMQQKAAVAKQTTANKSPEYNIND